MLSFKDDCVVRILQLSGTRLESRSPLHPSPCLHSFTGCCKCCIALDSLENIMSCPVTDDVTPSPTTPVDLVSFSFRKKLTVGSGCCRANSVTDIMPQRAYTLPCSCTSVISVFVGGRCYQRTLYVAVVTKPVYRT